MYHLVRCQTLHRNLAFQAIVHAGKSTCHDRACPSFAGEDPGKLLFPEKNCLSAQYRREEDARWRSGTAMGVAGRREVRIFAIGRASASVRPVQFPSPRHEST